MILKFKFYILALLLVAIPCAGLCEDKGKLPGVIKRKYTHVCPAGTERIGDKPPKSKLVFCRQVLEDGTRLEGGYTAFYRNGNKKIEGEYIAGKRNGTWTAYYRGGQLAEKKEFIDGKVVEKVAYSKRGEVLKKNDSKSDRENKLNAESEFSKSLRYKKSASSASRTRLSWAPRRSNR